MHLALAGPVLLFFAPVLFFGRAFYFRDNGLYFFPHKALIAQALREGRLPQWNPFEFGGVPLLADPNFNVFHPLSLLTWLLPLPWGLSLFLAACALAAAYGTRRLALELGASEEGALVSALAFAWSGPLVSLIVSGQAVAPCFVPWLCAAGAHLGRRPGPRAVTLLAVAAALVFLSGTPEIGACGFALAGLLALDQAPPGGRVRALALSAGGFFLGGLLAAVQLLPSAAYVRHSSRGGGFAFAHASGFSLHPLRLLDLAFPFFTGAADAPGTASWIFPPSHQPYVQEIHAGMLVLVLALLGLRGEGARRRLPVLAFALLLVPVAMGTHTPLFGLLWDALPPLRMVRFPEKLIVPLALAIALSAGAGWERLRALLASGVRGSGMPGQPAGWWMPAAGLLSLGAALALAFPSLAGPALERLGEARAACLRATAIPSVATELSLLAVAALAAGLLLRGKLGAGPATLALAGALALDLGGPAARLDYTAGAEELTRPSPLVEEIARDAAAPAWSFRVSSQGVGLTDADLEPEVPRPLAVHRLRHAAFFDAGAALAGIHLDRGYSGFTPAGLQDVYTHAEGRAVLDQLGVRYGVEYGRGQGYFGRLRLTPWMASGPLLRVFKNPTAREKLRLVGTVLAGSASGLLPRCAGEEAAWLSPADVALLPSGLLALPGCPAGPKSPATTGDAAATGSARVLLYQPEHIEAQLEASVPALAVLNDTWAPGWSAQLDGAPVPTLAADGAFRAVAVPPGHHLLSWTYRAPGLLAGALLTILGLGTLGGLIGWSRASKR